MSAERLYTPEVLAAAVSLAARPLDPRFELRGTARSASCGSQLELGLLLDDAGTVSDIGIAARACAIGQASAAIFADGVTGKTASDIDRARMDLAAWLVGKDAKPDWPGLDLIAPARAYPARHGAIMLSWIAACRALGRVEA
ncbi:iron-sulfur cluster assembly scaffold protein [Croceicoccus naphthovorans]|uniref:Fe-S cluster protein n=1 Tax=Croceicoccus naphthovorans TaxID=1348774 RepID=A0A0G3XI61_9SPHN|nr:iron-sulfur cluster assembly scaffold protein [Croceicoccus naphthovorans]AKM10018.1 Fe-S cluster protein [Croceicoccus naphthovorans]MBB3991101.1 NifU-like protein involved in Fe-S cluster formation [Croceicoccus naphthovorans]